MHPSRVQPVGFAFWKDVQFTLEGTLEQRGLTVSIHLSNDRNNCDRIQIGVVPRTIVDMGSPETLMDELAAETNVTFVPLHGYVDCALARYGQKRLLFDKDRLMPFKDPQIGTSFARNMRASLPASLVQ